MCDHFLVDQTHAIKLNSDWAEICTYFGYKKMSIFDIMVIMALSGIFWEGVFPGHLTAPKSLEYPGHSEVCK